MKLLFYSDMVFGFGGVERVLAEIAKVLSHYHDVTILTTDARRDLSMYGYAEARVKFEYIYYPKTFSGEKLFCKAYSFLFKKYLPHTQFTSNWYARSSFLPAYRKLLIRNICDGKYDAIIGVHAFASLHLAAISRQVNIPVIGWIHNSYQALFEKENPYLPGLKEHFHFQISKLDRLIVLSHSDVELFKQKMELNAECIYNPLTLEPKGLGNPIYKTFLAVGRFSFRHKGFDILINAFAQFARTNPDWKLDIVGEGPEEELYRSLIAEYKLEDRVVIYPFTKDIQQYYSKASVYVLSSRWEGFGLVLVEAMAHGLPIVSSDVLVALELLKGKGVATFFENGSVEDLVARLHYMACDADLERMGRAAYNYSKLFDIHSTCKQWCELLQRV